jgi:hypothetical protein
MNADDMMMKNKATDLSNLPPKPYVKPGLKPGPLLPLLLPTIFSTLTFVVSNEVEISKCGWYN